MKFLRDTIVKAIEMGHKKVSEIVEFIRSFGEEALNMGLPRKVPRFRPPRSARPGRGRGFSRWPWTGIKGLVAQCVSEKVDKKHRELIFDSGEGRNNQSVCRRLIRTGGGGQGSN